MPSYYLPDFLKKLHIPSVYQVKLQRILCSVYPLPCLQRKPSCLFTTTAFLRINLQQYHHYISILLNIKKIYILKQNEGFNYTYVKRELVKKKKKNENCVWCAVQNKQNILLPKSEITGNNERNHELVTTSKSTPETFKRQGFVRFHELLVYVCFHFFSLYINLCANSAQQMCV